MVIQLKGQISINVAFIGISHRGNAGIKLDSRAIEVEGIRCVIRFGSGKSQILLLSILHMLHPSALFIRIRIKTGIAASHIFGLVAGFIDKVIFFCRLGNALIHIHLYGVCVLAVFFDQSFRQGTGIGHLGSVNSRLGFRLFPNRQGIEWFFRIRATGKSGDACGFYINKSPKPVTVVTIA